MYNTVAPAQAGAYPGLQFNPEDVMGPSLRWGDAHWVDVAMRLDLPLVTADLRLARAVPDEVAIVVYLGDDQAA